MSGCRSEAESGRCDALPADALGLVGPARGGTLGTLLVPLGQASLYVYILQSILTFVLVNRAMHRPWLALAITLGMIGAVWTMVKYRVLFRVVPR